MLKKGGLFFLFFLFLKAEYVVGLTSDAYKKLSNYVINCVKYEKNLYLCYKSDDIYQLKRFVNFAAKNGVNAKIIKILDKDILNLYSIQVCSTKSLKTALKFYKKFKNFNFARIEKIGSYYTLRIGASKNKQDIIKLFKKLKIKGAFVRRADIKIKRIIKSNFIILKNIKNLKLQKNFVDSKKEVKKQKNYKKLCDVYTVLALVRNNKKYEKTKNKICYKYHMQNFKKTYSDISKINELNKAMKYEKNEESIILLNYYNAKIFQTVDIKSLNSLNIKTLPDDLYTKYLKTLFFAGDLSKFKSSCLQRNNFLCDLKDFNFKNISINDYDIKNFLMFLGDIKNAIKSNNLQKASENIDYLYQINKQNVIAMFLELKLELKKNNFKKVHKLIQQIKSKNLFNKEISQIVSNVYKKETIDKIKNYLKQKKYHNAQKEISILIDKYPDDYEINILAADFYKSKSIPMANFYYQKAYNLDKKKFFLHMLKNKNYEMIMKYERSDLQKYPYIFSKVYLCKAKKYLNKNKNLALKYAIKSFYLYPSSENSILIGKIYFQMKDYKNCIKYLKNFDNNDYLKYYLGYSYYKIGNIKEAKKYFNQIINTKDESLKTKLLSVYIKMGEKEKVKKLLDTF